MDHRIITAIERAIALFGSEERLAKEAGVSQPAINKCRRTGRIGIKVAAGIDRATQGKVSIVDLIPIDRG